MTNGIKVVLQSGSRGSLTKANKYLVEKKFVSLDPFEDSNKSYGTLSIRQSMKCDESKERLKRQHIDERLD